ncbi:thiol reductant ABC exporter subunit CydC [Cellulomonas xylanilytica]|uniref:Thiol reductant ABC exporter subunit CydC n=1 Tax=Cellulomonas xylanilytica TaxID=233583 RepID=A0A510V8S5_9CELL|nr:thiol reductant ABC exporter subunit CydC [Cellulomonas xylanilytica]GEK21565.1 thiol reductant ABC exporter subunit CydC [Cellulomonas xylanilytica]
MTHGTLRRAVRLLDLDPRRFALALLLGTLALGCGVALAAVSAWLIARASQMPPVLQLSVATVAVRAFGIGRGVLRYLERLVSHDVALRGMTQLRTTLYERLAVARPETLLAVRRGDLLARVGADVDTVGDVVVRGLLPAGVAAVLGAGTVLAMCALWPPAGLALGACLVLAGVVAPAIAARAARSTEQRALQSRADMTATALGLLDDAGPLRVAGRAEAELAALRESDRRLAAAADAGAGPAAIAAGLGQLAVGIAMLAALLTGVPAVGAGLLSPVELAVVVLTPLAAFEATSLLPAAAIQVQRSRAAAVRVLALLDAPTDSPATDDAAAGRPPLVASDLACGWPGAPAVVTRLSLDLRPGRSVALVGPSGTGKTTALLTLAGLLPRQSGSLTLDGHDVGHLDRHAVAAAVVVGTEDAHVFGTTVLENLRVARGDLTATEATGILARVGLTDWLAGLPDGLDTVLGPDARTVSGGERRRLLVARALASSAPLLLVDEPAEHLDPDRADALVTDLLADPRGVVVVTHRLSPLAAADEVVLLDGGRVRARGSHATLVATVPDYRDAYERERAND